MNPNLLIGTVSFVLWSTFSTWYYVTNIRQLDNDQENEIVESVVEEKAKEVVEEVVKAVIEDSIPISKPIRFESTLYFALDDLTIKGKEVLNPIVDSLNGLEPDRQIIVTVVGHTCDLGSDSYNMELGLGRANNVGSYLQENLNREVTLSTDSKGENEPDQPNDSEQNRARNRRAIIIITSEP